MPHSITLTSYDLGLKTSIALFVSNSLQENISIKQ